MWTAAELLLAFVALYPVCTAALWIAGGLIFRLLDEPDAAEEPDGGWPGVTVLIPAYNEEAVIATCVAAAMASDYPELEVLVLDDGSTDATEAAALEAFAGDAALPRDPRPGQPRQGRPAERRLQAGASRPRRRHGRRHAPASPGAQAARGPPVPLADPRRCGGRAARHQPRQLSARDAGPGGGRDHRPDPPHPVPDRTGRRRGRRPRSLSPRPRARRRRLRPANGDRGHRPDVEAPAPRLADGVRAARGRRDAGSGDDPGVVDAAQALGARPGRGAPRAPRRGEPLAQPSHVAAEHRGGSRR